MFKTGEYIVQLHKSYDVPPICFIQNYCYKQRSDSDILEPENDGGGSRTNGWGAIRFSKPETWRYATKFEITYYNMKNKPYLVTIIDTEPIIEDHKELIKLLKKI